MSEKCSGSCGSCSSAGNCQNRKVHENLAGVKHFLLVFSGKGGVGKSTVAAGVAVAAARAGKKVGLFDVDFHGPSQPTLFGLQSVRLDCGESGGVRPVETAGIKLVSIGLLLEDDDQAVIWRGPAKIGALKQLLEETEWGELDELVLDFPPGTGDEILSACQMIPDPKQALIVTTPQEMALADCRKCIDFCHRVDIDILGVLENMSGFVCPDCGRRHDIFASGGGAKMAEKYRLPLLARLPVDPAFMEKCDFGDLPGALDASPEISAGFAAVAGALRTPEAKPEFSA